MAITTVKKSKLGYEDILFDVMGTGATTETLKSDGTYRTVQKVNASHLPITSTARAKKFADGTTVSTTDVDATIAQILDDLEDLGQPTGTTIDMAAGVLKVATGGIKANELATDAVETIKIKNGQITNAKTTTDTVSGSGSGATGTNCVRAASIGETELGTAAVSTAKIKDLNVTNDKIADATIKAAKMVDVPPRFIKFAGTVANAGAAAAVVLSVSGVEASDVVLSQLATSANVAVVRKVFPDTGTITITYDTAPGACTISYLVLRAVTA